MINRDVYFHRVQLTDGMIAALEKEVNNHTKGDWRIQFSKTFWYRILDRTNPKKIRDFGWYENMGELVAKLEREFPGIDFTPYKPSS